MLVYDYPRGVSVVLSPDAWNLLSFDLGDNTLFTPLRNKKPPSPVSSRWCAESVWQRYMFFSELDGKEEINAGNRIGE